MIQVEVVRKKKRYPSSKNAVSVTIRAFDLPVSVDKTPTEALSCAMSAGTEPELVRKATKYADSENAVAVTFHASGRQPISICGSPMKSPSRIKSAGSIENFVGILSVAHNALFKACMQVMWNAVFYDPIADYACAWRKRNRWSSHSILPVTVASFKQDVLCKNSVCMTGEISPDHVCSP